MTRKNLSGVAEKDLLAKFMFTDRGGRHVFALHRLADYSIGSEPIGTFRYKPTAPSTVKLELAEKRAEAKPEAEQLELQLPHPDNDREESQ